MRKTSTEFYKLDVKNLIMRLFSSKSFSVKFSHLTFFLKYVLFYFTNGHLITNLRMVAGDTNFSDDSTFWLKTSPKNSD